MSGLKDPAQFGAEGHFRARVYSSFVVTLKECQTRNRILRSCRNTHISRKYTGVPSNEPTSRLDQRGDLENVVTVSSRKSEPKVTLISFKRDPLEEYLAVSNSVLVRMFEFRLYRRKSFSSWPDGDERKVVETDELFYRQRIIDGYAGYARGIQIIRPRRPKAEIFSFIKGSWSDFSEGQYVEFLAYDWRNKCTLEISTDPVATTNYFEAPENSLPFELSPAFFNPDVLLKYKADRDKYTTGERDIHCRGTWTLRGFDVNDGGQVHAYICDLRNLPYLEQLYWKSFNEEPLAGISKRAIENDFKGEWSSIVDPLQEVLSIVERWDASQVCCGNFPIERYLNV